MEGNSLAKHFKARKDLFIGIDLGSFQSVVSTFSPQKLTIPIVIPNRLANAATPSIIYYGTAPREIGEEAEGKLTRDPYNTVMHFCSLAGASLADIERLRERFEYTFHNEVVGNPEEPTTLLSIFFADEPVEVPLENCIAHFLKELYHLAILSSGETIASADTHVSGTVVSIPTFVTEMQRKILYRACKIANLKNVSLVSHADAVLNWWIHRTRPHIVEYLSLDYTSPSFNLGTGQRILSSASPTTHGVPFPPSPVHFAIVDIGHAQSTIQILVIPPTDASSVAPMVKSIAEECNSELGTYDMISVLTKHCLSVWNNKNGVYLSSNSRQGVRLFHACSKALKDLSGLKESTIDLEAFVDEDNFRYTIRRELFERLCEPLKFRLEKLMVCALVSAIKNETSLTSWTDLFAIEIVGGGCRIPFVQQCLIQPYLQLAFEEFNEPVTETTIESYKKAILRKTLDGNSSVAMGAALYAADSVYSKFAMEDLAASTSPDEDISSKMPPANFVDPSYRKFNEPTAKQQDYEAIRLKESRKLEKWFEEKDLLESKYRQVFHDLESFILDIKRAMKGPYSALLSYETSEALEVAENWIQNSEDCNMRPPL
ncbi:hypothetical protein IE077_002293, partial [Cardiosporidium cionae]